MTTGAQYFVALTLALLCGMAHGNCEVEAAVAQLESEVIGPMDAKQRQDTRRILLALCGGTSGTDTASAPATEQLDEPASTKLFGIEMKRADEDSRGHERLKNRR